MRTAVASAVVMILLAPGSGRAFEAMQADIIGLHLGMADTDVAAAMHRQGFTTTRDHSALVTRTKDGKLTVDFTADHLASQIRYTFDAKGVGEADKILAAVLDHFGPPDQRQPMAWCRTHGHDNTCPGDEAALTFRPDTLTLLLRAGTSRND